MNSKNNDYTKYLYEAQFNNDLEMVRFLLNNGADPNGKDSDGTPIIWNLQYLWDEESYAEVRYGIAKLFFEYGADPNIKDEMDAETLYDFVLFKVVEDAYSYQWEYLFAFFKLLVINGGGGEGYPKPEFYAPVDKAKADDYNIILKQAEDGYHIEVFLVDKAGTIVAQI